MASERTNGCGRAVLAMKNNLRVLGEPSGQADTHQTPRQRRLGTGGAAGLAAAADARAAIPHLKQFSILNFRPTLTTFGP